MADTPDIQVYTGLKAWDVIWKWTRFAGMRAADERAVTELHAALSELGARSVLDCACGLGSKTCALGRLGYDIEGSDGSGIAIEGAADLVAERGSSTRFFRSRWDELETTAGRQYDCVLMDSWDWNPTRRELHVSAKAAYAVVRGGGTFLFQATSEAFRDTAAEIEEEMAREGRFQGLPVCQRDGVTLTVVISREKTPDGILGNRIHVVSQGDRVRVEVASVPDTRKWTWSDYEEVLAEVGFRDLRTVLDRGTESLNAATK